MDNKFITVLTVTYPHELAIIRGRLESEGIECFAQDELTIQVNPLYSNAVGGIKLQVRESDCQRAVEILKEEGYVEEAPQPPTSYDFNKFTSSIPLLGKLRIEARLLIILAILTAIIVIIAYLAMSPIA